jgi:hypothetical protein
MAGVRHNQPKTLTSHPTEPILLEKRVKCNHSDRGKPFFRCKVFNLSVFTVKVYGFV